MRRDGVWRQIEGAQKFYMGWGAYYTTVVWSLLVASSFFLFYVFPVCEIAIVERVERAKEYSTNIAD